MLNVDPSILIYQKSSKNRNIAFISIYVNDFFLSIKNQKSIN